MKCFGEKNKSYHCKIVFLDDTELLQEIQANTYGQELLDVAFKHLNLLETAYFGLRYLDNTNQTHWLDPTKKTARQLKGTDPFTLYFGVKFYASDPCKLLEEITRYQFFLQVKQDVLQGRLPVSFDLAAELGAFCVQSELGDYDARQHQPGYAAEFNIVANQTSDLENQIEELHRTVVGQVPAVAEINFLEKVKWLDMYGVDLHPVLGEDNIEYFLGLTPSGVIVLRNKTKVGNYFWPRITKVYFKGKYFMLRVRDKSNEENTYGFELPSKQACKHLWKCCVEHHAFFRLTQVTTNNSGKLFRLSSRFRHSGITERQVQSDLKQQNRLQPHVVRVASRRYQRRFGQPDGIDSSLKDCGNNESEKFETQSNLSVPQPVHLPTSISRTSSMPNASVLPSDSPRSTRSAPWEDPRQRGMFSSSTNPSPRSVRSAGHKPSRSHGFHRSPSVESEDSTDGRKKRHHHHHHHHSRSRRNSDNGSETSHVSKSSHSSACQHRSASRHRSSGSESESSQKHRHCSRKHKSRSNYELVDSEAQWLEVQKQQKSRELTAPQNAVIRDLSSSVRKSGYVNSGMESETEVNYVHRKKHRRSQTRSPSGSQKGPPSELKKHFEYSLLDSNGMSEDQLRNIPYTKVETDGKPFKVKYALNSRYEQRAPLVSHSSKGNAPSDQKVPLQADGDKNDEDSLLKPYSSSHAKDSPLSASSFSSLSRSHAVSDKLMNRYSQSFDLLASQHYQSVRPPVDSNGHTIVTQLTKPSVETFIDGFASNQENSDSGLGTEGQEGQSSGSGLTSSESYRSSPIHSGGMPSSSASPTASSASSSSHYPVQPSHCKNRNGLYIRAGPQGSLNPIQSSATSYLNTRTSQLQISNGNNHLMFPPQYSIPPTRGPQLGQFAIRHAHISHPVNQSSINKLPRNNQPIYSPFHNEFMHYDHRSHHQQQYPPLSSPLEANFNAYNTSMQLPPVCYSTSPMEVPLINNNSAVQAVHSLPRFNSNTGMTTHFQHIPVGVADAGMEAYHSNMYGQQYNNWAPKQGMVLQKNEDVTVNSSMLPPGIQHVENNHEMSTEL